MQIDRAAIFRFGKLADRTVDFAPGINIVYGKNEAGKTTLHAFLTAMLFGLEKGRGRAKGTEGYLRYEPWHAPSYYSGALQFSVGGRPFYLERNFYHKEPRARLCNLADGEELSVAYGDLGMLLGGVTREAYENTCDIPQCKAVTGAELTGLLAEYLSDMSDGGNAGIRVTRAVEKLEQKKRSLQSQIKSEQEKREQQLQQLTVKRRMLEEDCGRLREQIEKAAADMRAYARMHPQVRDGQRPEDARTAENAGTASDRERRADGNGFPVRSLFLGLAAAVGLPVFFIAKSKLELSAAAMVMVVIMLPFIFFALYEKDGQPAEKILGHVVKSMFLRDRVRPYRTDNLYAAIQREIKEKEDLQIEQHSHKSGKAQKGAKRRQGVRGHSFR